MFSVVVQGRHMLMVRPEVLTGGSCQGCSGVFLKLCRVRVNTFARGHAAGFDRSGLLRLRRPGFIGAIKSRRVRSHG